MGHPGQRGEGKRAGRAEGVSENDGGVLKMAMQQAHLLLLACPHHWIQNSTNLSFCPLHPCLPFVAYEEVSSELVSLPLGLLRLRHFLHHYRHHSQQVRLSSSIRLQPSCASSFLSFASDTSTLLWSCPTILSRSSA